MHPPVDRPSWQQRLTQAFVQLADALVVDFDVVEFLHMVVERSIELLAADDGGLMVAGQDGHLQLMAASSDDVRLRKLFDSQTFEGPCVDCYRSGEAVLNISPDGMIANWPHFGPIAVDAGYRYLHALPLQHRGRTVGAMNLFCSDKSPLSPNGVALGQGLADIAAVGLLQQPCPAERQSSSELLEAALAARLLIEQAKGVLAERTPSSLEAAFATLRLRAKETQRSLLATARDMLADDPIDPLTR